MSKGDAFHVTQRDDGSWAGTKVGNQRATVVGETQKEAYEKTAAAAEKIGGAEVRVHHSQDNGGDIRYSNTIGMKDENPPKG
jgi:hypothetical protein